MDAETVESAVAREVHTRALRLVQPNGCVPSERVQSIRDRRVLVFATLLKLIKDCCAARVPYADARRFAETGVWLVDKVYGRT